MTIAVDSTSYEPHKGLPLLLPVRTGPTEGPPPERTLGNAVIDWCEEYLLQPDGPNAGHPWRFTGEQVLFLLCWYEVDAQGRFVYRNGVLRRMKGWGKNPFGAAICAAEFVGPCRFGGWQKDGTPLAIEHHAAWVQTAAVAKDQTRNTTTLLPAMFSPQMMRTYGIDLGKELAYAHGGRCRLEAVTSSPLALEGARATFILRDETHHWLSGNEGHAMAKVIERNAAKSRDGAARVLSITNAHNPAEDSVGQRDYEAFVKMEAGRSRASGILYDCVEAPPETDLADPASLEAGLLAARGEAEWLDVPRLMNEIWDPRTDPSLARRYYLNQIVAAEDAWLAPQEWDLCARPDLLVLPGEEVALGFDGSKTDDHTAFVGCRISDGHMFTLAVWDPQDYGGEVPTAQVDAVVEQAFATYLVNAFFSDVAEWESYVDKWEAAHGQSLYVASGQKHTIGWDMRGRQKETTFAAQAFHDAVTTKTLTHEGIRRYSQYVYNARRRPNQYGVTFGKESRESPRKVDWLAAAMLARMARQQYLLLPENRKRRKRTGKAMFA